MKPNKYRNYETVRINVTLITLPLDFVSFYVLSQRSYTIVFIYSHIRTIPNAAKSNAVNWESGFTNGSSAIFLIKKWFTQQRFSNGSENFKLVEIYVPFLACQVFVFICFTRTRSRTHTKTLHLFPPICLSISHPLALCHIPWNDVLVFVYFPFLPQKFIKGIGRLWMPQSKPIIDNTKLGK